MLSAQQLDTFAAVFSVLARLQVEPASQETMDDVRSMIGQWPLAGSNDPTAAGILAIMGSGKEREIDVRRDQDALYGISASAKVPPFESVHRGNDHLIFDSETLEVRHAYRAMALQAPKLNKEPDDHIGLEIDFLAQCCIASMTAFEQGAEASVARYLGTAIGFTRDHILRWAPDMLQDAAEQAETAWVRGVELLTLGALQAWVDATSWEDSPADAETSADSSSPVSSAAVSPATDSSAEPQDAQ